MKTKKFKHLDLDIYFETLDNGLEVIIVPLKNINNVYATFSTKYGSNEIEFIPNGSKDFIKVPLGIAHFLEHKLFEQSDGVDPFSFFNSRGASANANTSFDKTTYLFSGADFFVDNINYLLDFVQSPYLTDENVLKEKGIITQEAKMYLDDSESVLVETLLNNCFHVNPYKYPIIGTIDSINSITKEDLITCYNTFYNPNNMFLVLTGNVDPNQAILEIKKNQDDKKIEKGKDIKLKQYDEDDTVCKEYDEIKFNVSIPKVAFGVKLKLDNSKLYENLIYTSLFFDINFGNTSLIVKELIENGTINDTFSLDIINSDKHILYFIANESKDYNILKEKVLNKFNNLDLNEEEFNRKKKTLLSSLIYMSDNLYKLNSLIMSDIIRYGSLNCDRYEQIKNLNFNDYKTYIESLDFSNIATCVLLPK